MGCQPLHYEQPRFSAKSVTPPFVAVINHRDDPGVTGLCLLSPPDFWSTGTKPGVTGGKKFLALSMKNRVYLLAQVETMKINEKSWPFIEAMRVVNEVQRREYSDPILFETGFGPSGLPHIGTFAEVARTTFVKNAFEHLTGRQGEIYVYCDDMDGLRKVPGNVPEQETLAVHLGKPISRIPDPFGCCDSYSGHMVNKLIDFLDTYGFVYTLKKSSEEYSKGTFNNTLHMLMEKTEGVKNIILPTLKEETRKNWSPFLPVCENCGSINATTVTEYFPTEDMVAYECRLSDDKNSACGYAGKTGILNGNAKVGWKVDWALRWYTFNIRYEMYGKDLIESAQLSKKIVKLLGGVPPDGFFYELFLDEHGKKISKSVGTGLEVQDWLKYAPLEVLLFFLYQFPTRQKRLSFDVIPKSVDTYLDLLYRYPSMAPEKQRDTVQWHIDQDTTRDRISSYSSRINFSLINNLVAAVGTGNRELLLDYLSRYDNSLEENKKLIDKLLTCSLNYYEVFIEPNKKYKEPDDREKKLLTELRDKLEGYDGDDPDILQSMVFDVARENEIEPATLFQSIYEILLGQERGPRFGTFTQLIGKDKMISLINQHLPKT